MPAVQRRSIALRIPGANSHTHNGANAIGACAAGYHMAQAEEISNPGVLDYDHSNGYNRSDNSLGGPPTNVYGWVRTGWVSATSSTPGTGNCQLWTSSTYGQYGSQMTFEHIITASTNQHDQDFQTDHCSYSYRTWCVED